MGKFENIFGEIFNGDDVKPHLEGPAPEPTSFELSKGVNDVAKLTEELEKKTGKVPDGVHFE